MAHLGLFIKLLLFFSIKFTHINGHGRLIDPPARSTAWRFYRGFPSYYTDNQMNCGGFFVQWKVNAGKCGICGEAWNSPRLLEKGGYNYRGYIVRSYYKNSVINIVVQISATHGGYVEFRICKIDNFLSDAYEGCFSLNVLRTTDGSSKFLYYRGYNSYNVVLPYNLVCSHCVLQWRLRSGNSWGRDPRTGLGCTGCGPQEEFYGCSDISVI